MLKPTTYAEVLRLTNLDTVIDLVVANTLNVVLVPTVKEMEGTEDYSERLIRKIDKVLWDKRKDSYIANGKHALEASLALDGYETSVAFAGHGGCVAKDIEDVVTKSIYRFE